MMRRIARTVVRCGVVYATTGVVGLGVMAWLAFRARRAQAVETNGSSEEAPDLSLAA